MSNEDELVALDVRVTGTVQGVGFRYYTREAATQRGVNGWVRNDADGSVRGHFEGPALAVADLVAWCRTGPPVASVQEVETTDAATTGASEFTIED